MSGMILPVMIPLATNARLVMIPCPNPCVKRCLRFFKPVCPRLDTFFRFPVLLALIFGLFALFLFPLCSGKRDCAAVTASDLAWAEWGKWFFTRFTAFWFRCFHISRTTEPLYANIAQNPALTYQPHNSCNPI